MYESDCDKVPLQVLEEARMTRLSKGILKDILQNLWWSKSIPYAFAVDEENLQIEIERYLYDAVF